MKNILIVISIIFSVIINTQAQEVKVNSADVATWLKNYRGMMNESKNIDYEYQGDFKSAKPTDILASIKSNQQAYAIAKKYGFDNTEAITKMMRITYIYMSLRMEEELKNIPEEYQAVTRQQLKSIYGEMNFSDKEVVAVKDKYLDIDALMKEQEENGDDY
ncbi:hypothetical protein [Reichenbachiella versicolor]|uniref:hypothetical protein n=1 Tax=Reichenbachiella versicolor TaxID=1821036 RepID=UPI000D6DCE5B|nr:hypothetical protein [Reichenbachiella versicolor]